MAICLNCVNHVKAAGGTQAEAESYCKRRDHRKPHPDYRLYHSRSNQIRYQRVQQETNDTLVPIPQSPPPSPSSRVNPTVNSSVNPKTSSMFQITVSILLVFCAAALFSLMFVFNRTATIYYPLFNHHLVHPNHNLQTTPMALNAANRLASGAAGSGTPYSISYVTIGSEEAAKKLANDLVSQNLAACVNIIPKVTSVYKWQEKIETDTESLLMIKSRWSILDQMTQFIKSNHPYETCEVISIPIQHGNQPYLDWIGSCVPEPKDPTPHDND